MNSAVAAPMATMAASLPRQHLSLVSVSVAGRGGRVRGTFREATPWTPVPQGLPPGDYHLSPSPRGSPNRVSPELPTCVPRSCVPRSCVPPSCVPPSCVPRSCVPRSCVPRIADSLCSRPAWSYVRPPKGRYGCGCCLRGPSRAGLAEEAPPEGGPPEGATVMFQMASSACSGVTTSA